LTLTERTIRNYRRQLASLGCAWDWSKELATSDPAYYRWTQWLFLRLFRAGLAYRAEAPVVWCPSCLTVLAREQLEGDRCERCGSRVVTRVLEQWFLRITRHADELLRELDHLDWPESAKRVQREWIGRSEGLEIDFRVEDSELVLSTFTTRPDTVYGVTFLVIPPEHPELDRLVEGTGHEAAVRRFAEESMDERAAVRPADDVAGARAKRGVFTGRHAIHPMTGAAVPIHVADYVVAGYGSGAVMGVPAHDRRDLAFARAMGIPVVEVVRPADPTATSADDAWTGEGVLFDSGAFTGMASGDARAAIGSWLEAHGKGRPAVRYRLRDWLISRQRYWGPPIPIVHCDSCGAVPVPEEELPVLLPAVEDFRPTGTGVSPLATVDSFVQTTCPSCGGPGHRETDVTDVFLDSAWYFLCYPSADVDDRPWDEERTRRMLPVDQYAGGPEHVMRHHLYARFVTRALHDLGLVPFAEPFPRLRLHGMVTKDGAKMSKSRGNVVNPDDYVSAHGADVTRMYLLFLGPWEEGGDFSDAGIAGIERFLRRTWRLVTVPFEPGAGGVDLRPLDRTVASVSRDLERLHFHTAIASLMERVAWASRARDRMSRREWDRVTRTLVLLLAPLAPHLAEELWSRLGGPYSVHHQPWPSADPASLADEHVTLVVQVDGRVRDRITAAAGLDRDAAAALALGSEKVRRSLGGRPVRRVVHVPDRVVNLLP
jgi:leucyl-tRNA synthetase